MSAAEGPQSECPAGGTSDKGQAWARSPRCVPSHSASRCVPHCGGQHRPGGLLSRAFKNY